jgi:NADH:ubiquinone oxidoreductase subunit E
MSISRRIADNQPDHFAFSAENKKKIKTILAKYPKERKIALSCHYWIWPSVSMITGCQ